MTTAQMADPPTSRYSASPPRRSRYRSRSRSPAPRVRSPSRSRSRSRSPPDSSNPGNNLFVTGLSTRTTEADLDDFFSREGKVVECRLVVDARSRASRGFAFITMESVTVAERCIKYLNGATLDGRVITVEKAKRSRPRTPTPGRYLGLRRPGYGDRRRYYEPPRDYHRSRKRDYSPEYSPYRSQRYARDRGRSPAYSPYRSPRHGYSRSRSPSRSPYSR
ncbi:hypothetical protein KP509_05G085700 [Ceratopteris richardii]|uniref:RRM domain-containing protein n=1 Tax=Ceratopteris richardii TaxID=49495 RepID=A0A8T2USX6_CERRI|nr:hypothetical protein KP509_05G085700 [Ceratopteris richardii]